MAVEDGSDPRGEETDSHCLEDPPLLSALYLASYDKTMDTDETSCHPPLRNSVSESVSRFNADLVPGWWRNNHQAQQSFSRKWPRQLPVIQPETCLDDLHYGKSYFPLLI